MYPQMQNTFANWMDAIQMQKIGKTTADFEVVETVETVVEFDAVFQVMKAEDADRKPEGLRQWKFYSMWTDFSLKIDDVVQSPDGVAFRVQDVEPWEQSDFFKYDLVEQPKGLGKTV